MVYWCCCVQLNAFATKFVIELQWMDSDLALLAMDPKWVGTEVGPWTGGGVVTVALRRLEESEIGSVFELDVTQKVGARSRRGCSCARTGLAMCLRFTVSHTALVVPSPFVVPRC